MDQMGSTLAEAPRWELYRLLGEPSRLRLIGLTSEDELSIGELAELTGEAQPNVSKHLKQLREAGLVVVRRQGTRALARLTPDLNGDPLLTDAVEAGRKLCGEDGSLVRVADIIKARDEQTRTFFAQPSDDAATPPVAEWSAYLTALRALLPHHGLAVDIGTGDGALVELLAPLFDRVIAVDRSEEQLKTASRRLSSRQYDHVELIQADYEDPCVLSRVQELGGADVALAVRLLHHAPRPQQVISLLGSLARPGGHVLVIDYCTHDDENMRDRQADLWLGFGPDELTGFAKSAGLINSEVFVIPAARYGPGPDAHLQWQVLAAQRDPNQETTPS
ncbi:MAG: metalloregulator ArsR/SmtB family transcription factor [Deltaproteobacteria bacterium]|nr:metalloregulator ArsR/SmtB family transcription factor [Deltaproteobacteria bacterium]